MTSLTHIPIQPSRYPFRASVPMCFTPAAMSDLLASVGSRPAESGAKGFAPATKLGFETIEFDFCGSGAASGAIYSPDTIWGNERCTYWMEQPDDQLRLWSGDLHSHPGGTFPSGKVGRGLGDIGYVEEVFAHNPWIEYFLLPILTHTGPSTEAVGITPWMFRRTAPQRPLLADLCVCPVEEFPDRPFNPVWEHTQHLLTPISRCEAEMLAAELGWPVALLPTPVASGGVLEVALPAARLQVFLPEGFPWRPPAIQLFRHGGEPLPTPWGLDWIATGGVDEPVLQVAQMCRAIDAWASEQAPDCAKGGIQCDSQSALLAATAL